MISRRAFLFGVPAIGVAAAGGAVWTAANETTNDFELTNTVIRVRDLPAEFESYRIAFLSDIHCGPCFPVDWVDTVLQRVTQEKPDLLLLGGDYLWIPDSPMGRSVPMTREKRFREIPQEALAVSIYEALGELLSPLHFPDGICAVYGNHDNWENPRECKAILSGAGVNFLVNDSHVITRSDSHLQVYGSDDYWTGRPRIPKAPNTPDQGVRILLTHNPDYVSAVESRFGEIFDFALAGHTHGGQIKLPGLGAVVSNIHDRRFQEGLALDSKFPVFTTRGIGVVEIPFRINCRPEIAFLEIVRA